jgi:hypothetical protein
LNVDLIANPNIMYNGANDPNLVLYGTATKYQCGAPLNLYKSPLTSVPICSNGIASRCLYSISDIYTGSPYNFLVMRYFIYY